MTAFVHYVVLEVPNISANTAFMGIFKGLEGLEMWFDVLEYAEGGNNDFVHRLPGRIRYPNLKLSWGLVSDEDLLKWFMDTHTKADTQEITLTLTAAKGDLSRDLRKFTFADAYPVHWSGPTLNATAADPQTWGETLEIAHSGLKLGP
ncbi:MAG TPA: phage tail protein [Solirubrobacteraceae bacterium]|jgi:phage tail-like protein|nr:phage tail protein [Solirubrobacteraceae bacterium]